MKFSKRSLTKNKKLIPHILTVYKLSAKTVYACQYEKGKMIICKRKPSFNAKHIIKWKQIRTDLYT